MRKEIVLILLMFLALARPSLAQDEPTGYEIGFFAAVADWKPHHVRVGPPQATVPFDLGFRYADRAEYGIRANFLSHGHWGGEVSYGYQRNTVNLTRPSFTSVELPGGIHHVFYNQIFYPVRYGGRVTPFVTAGVGWAAYQLSDSALERAADPRVYGIGNLKKTDGRVAFNYGAGVKANIVSGFGVRADFRHNFSDVPSYGLPKESPDPSTLVFPAQGKLKAYEFSVGIYFRSLSRGFQ